MDTMFSVDHELRCLHISFNGIFDKYIYLWNQRVRNQFRMALCGWPPGTQVRNLAGLANSQFPKGQRARIMFQTMPGQKIYNYNNIFTMKCIQWYNLFFSQLIRNIINVILLFINFSLPKLCTHPQLEYLVISFISYVYVGKIQKSIQCSTQVQSQREHYCTFMVHLVSLKNKYLLPLSLDFWQCINHNGAHSVRRKLWNYGSVQSIQYYYWKVERSELRPQAILAANWTEGRDEYWSGLCY